MEKKSYVPRHTKFLQTEDGSKQDVSYPQMNCRWCDNELTKIQVYDFLRGKSQGTACSSKCSSKLIHYKSKEDEIVKKSKKCKVCDKIFFKEDTRDYKVCSAKCSWVLSSLRMKKINPMHDQKTRKKVSNTLKAMNYKPIIQGGNGRGATVQQLALYNELVKFDDSFSMEFIERIPKKIRLEYKTPNHFKIDIASEIHKIAIEVDGFSHNTLKIKECDNRKNKVLSLRGWKVLRLWNSQIDDELMNCVQMVTSMISKIYLSIIAAELFRSLV
jgi:very-short-patch-repair endonuclease